MHVGLKTLCQVRFVLCSGQARVLLRVHCGRSPALEVAQPFDILDVNGDWGPAGYTVKKNNVRSSTVHQSAGAKFEAGLVKERPAPFVESSHSPNLLTAPWCCEGDIDLGPSGGHVIKQLDPAS